MISAITKKDSDKGEEQSTNSGSIVSKLRMFNQTAKKQSIIVGSTNQKNIHNSNINSYCLIKDQIVTTDMSGFVKVWNK